MWPPMPEGFADGVYSAIDRRRPLRADVARVRSRRPAPLHPSAHRLQHGTALPEMPRPEPRV